MKIADYKGNIPVECNICFANEHQGHLIVQTECCKARDGTILPQTYHFNCLKSWAKSRTPFICPRCKTKFHETSFLTRKEILLKKCQQIALINLTFLTYYFATQYLVENNDIRIPSWPISKKICINLGMGTFLGITEGLVKIFTREDNIKVPFTHLINGYILGALAYDTGKSIVKTLFNGFTFFNPNVQITSNFTVGIIAQVSTITFSKYICTKTVDLYAFIKKKYF